MDVGSNADRAGIRADNVILGDHTTMAQGSKLITPNERDARALESLGLSTVKEVMRFRPERVASINRSSDIFPVKCNLGGDQPPLVFVKRYRYRRWSVRIIGMFRGTLFGRCRARFEFEFLEAMRRLGVPAVRPMAWGQKRRKGFVKSCVLITEGEEGAVSLDRLVMDTAIESTDRKSLTVNLASLVRHMHAKGVFHGGLFWRNILISRSDGADKIRLIDPDKNGRLFEGLVSNAGVVSDLSDFAASASMFFRRSDLARFARAYFDCRKLSPCHKLIIRDIGKIAQRKARHERHRLAVGGMIAWVRTRMEAVQERGETFQPISSIQAFIDHVRLADPSGGSGGGASGLVHFTVLPNANKSGPTRYALTLGPKGVEACTEHAGRPDLSVETDEDAWLAIVNGRPDAFDVVREERIKLTGDTRLLAALAELV